MPELEIKPVVARTSVPASAPSQKIHHRNLNDMIWSDDPREIRTALLVRAWQKRIIADRVRDYTRQRLNGKRLHEIAPDLRNAETESYSTNRTGQLNAISAFYRECNDTSWQAEIDHARDVWRCPVEVDDLDSDYLNAFWSRFWMMLFVTIIQAARK